MNTILAAIGMGVLVLLVGNVPFNLLRAFNLEVGTAIPWAIVPAALYLWAYWRFLGGRWGAAHSAASRRQNLRANKLSGRVWVASLAAGSIGFAALIALLVLAARLVRLPASSPIITPPDMPVVTALSLLVMASIVAGITEEAAFRGYMQSPIERRYGLGVAVLVSGTLFGLLHFPTHPADVLWMLPYYIAVSAVYGGLTWAANSILPALLLHAAGDIVVLTRWWLTGRPEWQIGPALPPLVAESGIDLQFVTTAIAAIALVAGTVLAYRAVRRLRIKGVAPAPSALGSHAVALSAFALVGVGALVAARPLGAQPAELVLRGGAVFTADAANPTATAVAVRDGRIVYVGDDAGVAAFVGAATRTVEIGDGMLLPGFHDSHVHIAAGGLGLATCDLSADETVDAVIAHVAACARENASSAWVTGRGWQLGVFADARPTRQQLDAVVPDRPAFFMAADGHSAWVNSRALAEAQVTAATLDPQGGRIERDATTNEPSGTLRDIAVSLVSQRVPRPSEAEIKAGIVRAIALANTFGITSVHDANVAEALMGPYLALDREHALNARVTLAAQVNLMLPDVGAVPAEIARIERLRQRYRGERLRITAAKLAADGALEAQTAALLEPYVGSSESGPTLMKPDVFEATLVALDRAGIQVHVHSIGDRAARMSLDAVAAARAANGVNGPMHQLAHLQLVHLDDIPRFNPLRVAADIQGLWAYRDEETQELVEPAIGPERAARLYPLGSLERAGAVLVGGSDWSVTSMNPLAAIEVAITRRGARQPAGPAWLPSEVVTLDAMLLAYTINGARLQLHDDETGSITVGKAADLVVLDRNLKSVPATDMNTARVLYTFLDGAQVYSRAPAP